MGSCIGGCVGVNMNNTKDILEDMRKITMLTGELSSIHELNLKKWPYVAFEGVEKSEVDYDLSKDYTKEVGEGYVHFYLTIYPEHEDQKLLKERCDQVTQWVRNMFWEEINVTVFFNKVKQYSNSSLESSNEFE